MNNPLPSELREKVVSELLQYKAELSQGLNQLATGRTATAISADSIMQLFEQEYLRRIEAAKPTDWVRSDLLEGYEFGIKKYEHNLKQLSEGEK